jgi:hypothetical protein
VQYVESTVFFALRRDPPHSFPHFVASLTTWSVDAIAHARGSVPKNQSWYEDGKYEDLTRHDRIVT